MKWCSRSVWLSCGVFLPSYVLLSSFCPSYALPDRLEEEKSATTRTQIAQQLNREIYQPDKLPSTIPTENKPNLSLPNTDSAQSSPDNQESETTIFVRQIEILDSTVFTPEDFQLLIEEFEGKSVTGEELRNLADAITQLYLSQGYITSRAVLVEQEISDGIVQIKAIEGSLQEIQIEGAKRLKGYVRSRIALGADTPLRADRLEDQLLLLQDDPLIKSINARLQPGDEVGESIIVVEVTEANPFTADFSTDNYSPPILGSERLGLELAYGNVAGLGDRISASYKRSTTGDSNLWDFNYGIPLNPMNGTLQLRAFLSRSEFTTSPTFSLINQGQVTQETFDLELDSDYDLYQVDFRQPFIRNPRQEFALSFGFSHRNGQPLEALEAAGLPSLIADTLQEEGLETGLERLGLFNPELSEDKTSVLNLGVDYLTKDQQGVWALRSQFNFGTGLFDATIRDNSNPDGLFFSWLLQGQRLQSLSDNSFLIISADLQLTPNSLLPSEQFTLGGGQSLRGYRQNVRFGDNGFRFSVEDRISINKVLQLAPFVELGKVWNNPDNPTPIPDQRFLASAGLGLIVQPIPSLNIRLDYGAPFIDLDDRGDNVQDDGFYFSVNFRP